MTLWQRWLVALATTLVGGLYLHWKGPVPVVRVFDTLPIDAPTWYMISAFPVLGLLAADLLALALERRWRRAVELGLWMLMMTLLSHSRLELRIPISGHALLFAFAWMRWTREAEPAPRGRQMEQALAATLLGMVIAVKLLWWRDPTTLLVGVATAVCMSWAGRWWLARPPRP
jgi:hypothetical protein